MTRRDVWISERTFKGICGLFFGIAIAAAIARTVIQYRNKPRLALDDLFLLFACIFFIAATVLVYELVPGAYLFEDLEFDASMTLPADFAQQVVFNVRLLHAYTITSWLVVFAVKFCFLSFFRLLIDRVRRMIIYWRIVIGITSVFLAISLCETFIACPRIDVLSVECLVGSGFSRTLAIAATTKCLDIITDIMIVTVPVCLLWNVKIKPSQKLGVGAFLCLSIFMIILAITKASGLRTSADSFDLVWGLFWQQMEASVAVLMVSLTAFRSIFVSKKTKDDKKRVRSARCRRRQAWFHWNQPIKEQERPIHSSQPQLPFHLTLGTQFHKAQLSGLIDSRLEDGLSLQLEDEEGDTCQRGNQVTLDTHESGSSPPQLAKLSSQKFQSREQSLSRLDDHGSSLSRTSNSDLTRYRHWWQMGIISDFIVT